MFSQTPSLLIDDTKTLLKHIKSLRKLIYYAYFEPDTFRSFMAQTIPDVIKKLPVISAALKKALMPDDSGDDEFEVNALRSAAFRYRYQIDKEILIWRQLLQAVSGDVLSLEERGMLESFQQTWGSYFDKCGKLVEEHEVWKPVSHHNHIRMKELCEQVCGDLINQNRLLLKYYQTNRSACLKALFFQHEVILNLMTRYFTAQQKGQSVLYRAVNFQIFLQSIAKLVEVDRLRMLPAELNEKQYQINQSAHAALPYRTLKLHAEENLSSFLKHHPKFRKVLCEHLYDLSACQGYFSVWLDRFRQEFAIGRLERTCESIDADLAELRRRAAKQKLSTEYKEEINKAVESASELKALQDDRFETAVNDFQKGNLQQALKGLLEGVADFHGPSFVHAGSMVLNGQGCLANPALAEYLLMVGFALEDNWYNRLPICTRIYQAVEDRLKTQGKEETNEYRMTDEQLIKRIYLCRDYVEDKLFRLGEIFISIIISGVKVPQDEGKSYLERALFFFDHAHRYAKCAVERTSAILLMPKVNSVIQEQNEKRKTKLDYFISLIQEQLTLLNGDEYCQSAPSLVEAFYDRMKWPLPASDAPASGLRR